MRDVIVVGAGGGGPVAAAELAAQGLDVLVLEAGARFADPASEWTHFENDANNAVTGYMRFGPSDRDRSPWAADLPYPSAVSQVAAVGGTTTHFYGNCPRAMPGVFAGYAGADAAEYDTGHLFPFSYDSLIPYYEWVEERLPVQTAAMGRKEQAFLNAAAAVGLAHQTTKDILGPGHRAQENCILQPGGTAGRTDDPAQLTWPTATGCTLCGHCLQGCYQPMNSPRNLRARRSTDNSYVPMMLTADAWSPGGRAATLMADASVTKLLTEPRNGREHVVGVRFRHGGQVHEERASVVCLAGGPLQSPRLWLESRLPNPNGWVGAGLTDHYLDFLVGVMADDVGGALGAASAARADWPGYGGIENVCAGPAQQALSLTYSDQGISGYYDNGGQAAPHGADTVGRLVGPDLLDRVSDVNRLLSVVIITDDDVEKQNRVTLSDLPPTELGRRPRVVINHRNRSARTQRNREFLAARAVEILRAAGATSVHRSNWPPTVLHGHSTLKMGADPSSSVTSPTGETWAVGGLYVTDNSVLSNSLGGPNPTLTTQAVATRIAESIMTTHFAGDPWVIGGAPVSSIDDSVTQAVLARGL